MAEKKLGVLVHGAGWVSTQHIKAFETNPHAKVVAISSRKLTSCQARAAEAGLENIGLYDNYEQALKHDGVDIVSVCTPQYLHAENTIAAAESGSMSLSKSLLPIALRKLKRCAMQSEPQG